MDDIANANATEAAASTTNIVPPKPFGWAGWLTNVPGDWRPLRIQGTHERGSVDLGDATRPRAQLAWSTVTRKRFDAPRVLRRVLERAVAEPRVEVTSGAGLAPLLLAEDAKTGRRHFAGFAPGTRRVVQGFVEDGVSPEDRAVVTDLVDQAGNEPHKWSFFSIRFVVPTGFRYREAELTLGDMRVSLATGAGMPAAELHLRHVYPAKLALGRENLDAWAAREWVRTARDRRAKAPSGTEADTALGRAALCRKRRRARPWFPIGRRPLREQRCLAIHDETHQRLIILHAAAEAARMEGIVEEVVKGMHWQ